MSRANAGAGQVEVGNVLLPAGALVMALRKVPGEGSQSINYRGWAFLVWRALTELPLLCGEAPRAFA